MHPAPSIILFTTLSGAGFGLMIWIGLGFGPTSIGFGLASCALAFLLAGAGLVAALWHLGNPQRAWRALSQWRSSWLSREGVLAVATLGLFGLYALLWIGGAGRNGLLGLAAALLALTSVYSTSMIYASIKTVPRWAKSPTPYLFIAYALAGGALALATIMMPFAHPSPILFIGSMASLLAAGLIANWWSLCADQIHLNADGSTLETAIGLPNLGRARLFEPPHTSPNYLIKEMVFRIGRKHAEKIRRIAIWAAFIFPILILGLAAAVPSLVPAILLALPVHLLGVAASRWLFFAEAEHVVALYYGYR